MFLLDSFDDGAFMFCTFRIIFAIFVHVLARRSAFSLVTFLFASGCLESWLIYFTTYGDACISFVFFAFYDGSRCGAIDLPRICVSPKPIFRLAMFCFSVLITSHIMLIWVVLFWQWLFGFATPLVCAFVTHCLRSLET